MRPSCPLARSPTLTWCWTTRHVRARPYIRATRLCADLVSLGVRREAPRLCLCPVRGPWRRGRLYRQHEQRRALWPRAQGQRCEAERCGRRPPARCVARVSSSSPPPPPPPPPAPSASSCPRTRAVRACASAVWESQADTYYKDKKEEVDGGDAEGETGTA